MATCSPALTLKEMPSNTAFAPGAYLNVTSCSAKSPFNRPSSTPRESPSGIAESTGLRVLRTARPLISELVESAVAPKAVPAIASAAWAVTNSPKLALDRPETPTSTIRPRTGHAWIANACTTAIRRTARSVRVSRACGMAQRLNARDSAP